MRMGDEDHQSNGSGCTTLTVEEELRKVIKELELDLEDVLISRRDALNEVHNFQEIIREINDENDELVNDMQLLMEDCDELKQQNDVYRAENQDLREQLAKASEEISLCHETLEEQRSRRMNPERISEAVKNMKQTMDRKLRQSNNEKIELERMVEQLSEELEVMRDKMHLILNERKTCEKRTKALHTVIRQCDVCLEAVSQMDEENGHAKLRRRRTTGITGLRKIINDHQNQHKSRRNTWSLSETKGRQSSMEELPKVEEDIVARPTEEEDVDSEPGEHGPRQRNSIFGRGRRNRGASTGDLAEPRRKSVGDDGDQEEEDLIVRGISQLIRNGQKSNKRGSNDILSMLKQAASQGSQNAFHENQGRPEHDHAQIDDERSIVSAPALNLGFRRLLNSVVKRGTCHHRTNSQEALAAMLNEENEALNASGNALNEDRTLVSAPPALQGTNSQILQNESSHQLERRGAQPFRRLGSALRRNRGSNPHFNSNESQDLHSSQSSSEDYVAGPKSKYVPKINGKNQGRKPNDKRGKGFLKSHGQENELSLSQDILGGDD